VYAPCTSRSVRMREEFILLGHNTKILGFENEVRFSETLVNIYQTIRRYNPQDSTHPSHYCENLNPFGCFIALHIVSSSFRHYGHIS
jgi:hypothetical protein